MSLKYLYNISLCHLISYLVHSHRNEYITTGYTSIQEMSTRFLFLFGITVSNINTYLSTASWNVFLFEITVSNINTYLSTASWNVFLFEITVSNINTYLSTASWNVFLFGITVSINTYLSTASWNDHLEVKGWNLPETDKGGKKHQNNANMLALHEQSFACYLYKHSTNQSRTGS